MTESVPFKQPLLKSLLCWVGRWLLAVLLILLVLLFFVGMFAIDAELTKAKVNWQW